MESGDGGSSRRPEKVLTYLGSPGTRVVLVYTLPETDWIDSRADWSTDRSRRPERTPPSLNVTVVTYSGPLGTSVSIVGSVCLHWSCLHVITVYNFTLKWSDRYPDDRGSGP